MIHLGDIFGVDKPFIAMCHLGALPGRPRGGTSVDMRAVVELAKSDIARLEDGGVDGILFCNENDLPYQLDVGPEIVAAVAAVIGEVNRSLRVPFGVDVAWDAKASIAVARATGARFARGVFAGVYATDMGLINRSFGDLSGYRVAVGADGVALFSSLTPEFGACVGERTVHDRARDAAFLGIDALLVGGVQAGDPAPAAGIREAKAGAPAVPVLANTGVNHGNVEELLSVADGIIVGTSLKRDGCTWNEVDEDRVARMAELVKGIRAAGTSA